MSLKSFVFKRYAQWVVSKENKKFKSAIQHQIDVFKTLIKKNSNTSIGIKYNFSQITSYDQYTERVPLSVYEDYLPYIELLKAGEKNILTSEPTSFFLKTSGTTAGSKFIPMTKSGLRQQMDATLYMLCYYCINTDSAKALDYKMIFIQGSPKLDYTFAIPSGRLSGLVYNYIPPFFRRNTLPSYETNCIEDWDKKIDKIVDETVHKDMSGIGGIPPWCIQYFEKLLDVSKKKNLAELYKNLEVYIYGGVDFSSYRHHIVQLLGEKINLLQTFPASEGFFAYQNELGTNDMILLTHHGIFYEFIPFENTADENPKTITLDKVKQGEKYELVITTLSGLYRYRMGDLVEFSSTEPYKVKVVGRTKQFISAFGEHIILQEVETAMADAISKFSLSIADYLLSPNVAEKRYEWRIEWIGTPPANIDEIATFLDAKLCEQNSYYKHLIDGHIINPSIIISIKSNTFNIYRNLKDKSGGQNKVVKISNDDKMAKEIDEINGRV